MPLGLVGKLVKPAGCGPVICRFESCPSLCIFNPNKPNKDMEIIFLLLGIIFLVTTVFTIVEWVDENEPKYFLWNLVGISVFLILIFSWTSITDLEYENVEIHTATTQETDFKYYIDNEGVMRPVPNHATSVEKVIPRAGSVDDIKYNVKY